jgi:cobalt-zinc-cadmium efflux system outer membrane protein
MRTLLIIAFVLLLNPMRVEAQQNERPAQELGFSEFLQVVLLNNLELISEQFEVSAAEAALKAARVFQDPELEMIFPMFNREDFGDFPANIAFEMEVPVELFGKRRNRIRQAEAEKFAAQAGLEDFLRYLRSDAANAFVEVLTHQLVLERMNLTLEQLNQLIEINQALFEVGEIGEIDVLQTRLEARKFQAELFDIRSDFAELMSEVYFLMGGIPADSLVFTGNMELQVPLMSFDDLRRQALENRPDLRAALHEQQAAEFAMRLARSERLPDISVIAGYHNEEALRPIPGIRAAYGGLIIPLQFSGFNRGAYLESTNRFEQSGTIYQLGVLTADTELRAAWEKHQLLTNKRTLFTESILQDAERVRDAVVFSYQRGEVSLLEVLEAQRTLNEIYMNYYETLNQHSQAVIRLAQSSGLWFVEF